MAPWPRRARPPVPSTAPTHRPLGLLVCSHCTFCSGRQGRKEAGAREEAHPGAPQARPGPCESSRRPLCRRPTPRFSFAARSRGSHTMDGSRRGCALPPVRNIDPNPPPPAQQISCCHVDATHSPRPRPSARRIRPSGATPSTSPSTRRRRPTWRASVRGTTPTRKPRRSGRRRRPTSRCRPRSTPSERAPRRCVPMLRTPLVQALCSNQFLGLSCC